MQTMQKFKTEELRYGISLRPLSVFANEVYKDCNVSRFAVKLTGDDAAQYTEKDITRCTTITLSVRMF